jgi:hypothetical protein
MEYKWNCENDNEENSWGKYRAVEIPEDENKPDSLVDLCVRAVVHHWQPRAREEVEQYDGTQWPQEIQDMLIREEWIQALDQERIWAMEAEEEKELAWRQANEEGGCDETAWSHPD